MSKHPSIPRAKYDNSDQSRQAEAVKQSLDIGLRRTNNLLDSFITLRDLINATKGGLKIGPYTITITGDAKASTATNKASEFIDGGTY